ncbi:MAG: hypothetical protein PHH49_08360 [Candidatus Omnitrophica bacterium]|nr:hypothetical protein [Candidatus Omnitrophota bacterium]
MAWVMPVIEGVMTVMEAITFIQFIEEEAIQSAGLGAFLAIRQKDFHSAYLAINLLEDELLPHLEAVNQQLGWIAIYSQGAFRDFAIAGRTNVAIYKELCTYKA